MTISEKQIMQLMEVAQQYSSLLLLLSHEDKDSGERHDAISRLLNTIHIQQSEELKVIE